MIWLLFSFFFLLKFAIMLNIWNKKKTEAEAQKKNPHSHTSKVRLQKDLSQLEEDSTWTIKFPDPNNRFHFIWIYSPPRDCLYGEGTFRFSFDIPDSYPHQPPKVLCQQKIYHPNIDTEGHVCLNVLREDWTPALSVQSVLFGLQMLFMSPNPEDPLNKEAAQNMKDDYAEFKRNVRHTMWGERFGAESYDKVMK